MPLYHTTCSKCGIPFSHSGYKSRTLCDKHRPRHTPGYQQRYRQAHREQKLVYGQAYREAHAEELKASFKARYWANRTELLEKSHSYQSEHREQKRAYDAIYRETHKEERLATRRAYAHNHRDKERGWKTAKHVRKQGVIHIPYERHEIYERDKGRCQLCQKRLAFSSVTIDHIVPISLGGADAPYNVQIACLSCNARKQHVGRIPSQTRLAF